MQNRKPAPLEHHLGELLWGVDVERAAGLGMNLALKIGDRSREAAAQLLEDGEVETDPVTLHRLQYRHEGKLHGGEHFLELLVGKASRELRCDGPHGACGLLGFGSCGRLDAVAAAQGQEVGGFARGQQVAREHRVPRHRGRLDPCVSERSDQGLRVVTPHTGEVRCERFAQPGCRGGGGSDAGFGQRDCCAGCPEQGVELYESDLARRRHDHRLRAPGRSQLGEEGSESESLVQVREPVGVRRSSLERREGLGERDVGANSDELTGELHFVPVLGERLAGAWRRDLVEVCVDLIDRAPSRDELLGTLLADPGTPRDVVGAVAHEGQDLTDPGRSDAEHLLDAALVEQSLQARVPHLHVRVPDQLHEVLVGRGDDDLETGGLGPLGQRADDVVGLDIGLSQDGETEERHGLLGDRNLHPEVIGHRRSVRLVALVQAGPEGLLAGVERDGNVRGRELAQQLVLHSQKTVRRVGGCTVGGRQAGTNRVERAVEVGVTVHQQKSWHVRTIARGPGLRGWGPGALGSRVPATRKRSRPFGWDRACPVGVGY